VNILLVDDDATVRAWVARELESRGHVIIQVATSWDAYCAIEDEKFDAAIVDYDLGLGQDTGPNILRAIKRHDPTIGTCLYSGLTRPDCEDADLQIVKSDPRSLLSWIEYEATLR
jgi:two-component system cell cycle sensor histidine kinase/response regulator CckA